MTAAGWYRTELRLSICSKCGEVVEAPRGESGGAGPFRRQAAVTTVCACGTEVTLPERAPIPRAPTMDERTRLDKLIEQDDRLWETPAGLEAFDKKRGEDDLAAVATEWQRARANIVGSGATPDAVDRLLWLTIRLRNRLPPSEARRRVAFTSAALDVVTELRHRQTVIGWLAFDAVRAGEMGAAEELLALCDPRPTDLWADTAYRIGRAWILTNNGDFLRVLELLGERAEDIPTADHSDDLAAFLRANALEKTGQLEAAVHGLARRMAAGGQPTVAAIQGKNPDMCERCYPAAVERVEVMAKEARQLSMGRSLSRSLVGKVAQPVGVMAVVVALAAVGAAIAGQPALGLDRSALVAVGVIAGVFAALGLRFGGITRRASKHEKRLRAEGVAAKARIVGAQPAGLRVNGREQTKMALVVHAPGHVPFRTFHVELPPQGADLETGKTLPVLVDPKDPGDLVIDWQSQGLTAAGFRPRALLWALFPLTMIFGVGGLVGTCMGYEPVALERLNACPRATELLGAPIERGYLGMSCGSAETGGGSGNASWTMPVVGPHGRGTYSFYMEQHGGPWTLLRGDLEVGDTEVDVVNCTLATGGQAARTTRRLAGTITATVGRTPAPTGTECEVAVGPGDGPFGCRIRVSCGGRMLYGATETTGFVACRTAPGPDGGELVSAQDSQGTAGDRDPILDLREEAHELVVSDQGEAGTWAITITLR